MTDLDTTPDYVKPKILILGCGNILFGDDGFGPEVVKTLQDRINCINPNCTSSNMDSGTDSKLVYIMDVGTSAREILFDITISDIRPKKMIIIDAVDKDCKPGEIFEIHIDDLPENKIDDFSIHQMPTSNLLKELKDLCNVDIAVLVCQVEYIPEEVEPGLSETLQAAVPKMVELVMKRIQDEVT